MATTIDTYNMHDHAGARWLAAFATPFILTVLAAFAMLLYPHVTG